MGEGGKGGGRVLRELLAPGTMVCMEPSHKTTHVSLHQTARRTPSPTTIP